MVSEVGDQLTSKQMIERMTTYVGTEKKGKNGSKYIIKMTYIPAANALGLLMRSDKRFVRVGKGSPMIWERIE